MVLEAQLRPDQQRAARRDGPRRAAGRRSGGGHRAPRHARDPRRRSSWRRCAAEIDEVIDRYRDGARRGRAPGLGGLQPARRPSTGPSRERRDRRTRRALGASFWRLFTSSSTSNLSDGIQQAALPLLAATLTRDPVAVSRWGALAFLPWLLFALPAGTLVDRVNRRTAMAVGQRLPGRHARACSPDRSSPGHASLPILYAVAFLLGCAETVYDSAARAMLPNVVDARPARAGQQPAHHGRERRQHLPRCADRRLAVRGRRVAPAVGELRCLPVRGVPGPHRGRALRGRPVERVVDAGGHGRGAALAGPPPPAARADGRSPAFGPSSTP